MTLEEARARAEKARLDAERHIRESSAYALALFETWLAERRARKK
jgi:hypothetical protein